MRNLRNFFEFRKRLGDFVPKVDSGRGGQTGEVFDEFFGNGKELETEKLEKRKNFVIERGANS